MYIQYQLFQVCQQPQGEKNVCFFIVDQKELV